MAAKQLRDVPSGTEVWVRGKVFRYPDNDHYTDILFEHGYGERFFNSSDVEVWPDFTLDESEDTGW